MQPLAQLFQDPPTTFKYDLLVEQLRSHFNTTLREEKTDFIAKVPVTDEKKIAVEILDIRTQTLKVVVCTVPETVQWKDVVRSLIPQSKPYRSDTIQVLAHPLLDRTNLTQLIYDPLRQSGYLREGLELDTHVLGQRLPIVAVKTFYV